MLEQELTSRQGSALFTFSLFQLVLFIQQRPAFKHLIHLKVIHLLLPLCDSCGQVGIFM